MSVANMWHPNETDPGPSGDLKLVHSTEMPEASQDDTKIIAKLVSVDPVDTDSPAPLEVVQPLVQSPEEAMRAFLATASERDDLLEEMFDGSDLIPRLENKTPALPIVNAVVSKMYKNVLPQGDLKALKTYIAEQHEAYVELIDDNGVMVELVAQAGRLADMSSDLMRGMQAFSDAANQFNNFMYRDTSLRRAEAFCSYLVARDLF